MFKAHYLTLLFVLALCSMPSAAQEKASDFFKNLSKEKNLLNALYNKARKTNQDNNQKPFTLSGEAGMLGTSGNTNTNIIKLAMESSHEMTNWSNRYESQFLQRTNTIDEDGFKRKVQTTRVEISGQFDYKLVQPNNRLFAYVEYDDNEFNRLRHQATIVLGWSQVAWKEKNSELRYSIGPGYSHIKQERTNQTIEEGIVRGTLLYNLTFGNNTRFRQTLSAEMGEVIKKARSQSSITAKIFGKVAMKLSLNLILNDNVANLDSDFSTQTSVSMVYQFF